MSLCAEKCFSLTDSFAWAKKTVLFRKPKVFLLQKALQTSLKAVFYAQKTSFACTFLCCPQKFPIFTNQKPFFRTNLYELSSKAAFFTCKKPFFCPNLFLFLSKATLFHPPPPISTPLNLLFAKNTAVLLLFALILCCKAGASHRFKSLPAIPGEVAAFRKTGYLMNAGHFRKNHVSTGDLNRPRSPEVRKPLVYFWFFSYTRKE